MKQLADQAKEKEVLRDEAIHRYHNYEYAVGALEIAIVLASVSVVTRMRLLTIRRRGDRRRCRGARRLCRAHLF